MSYINSALSVLSGLPLTVSIHSLYYHLSTPSVRLSLLPLSPPPSASCVIHIFQCPAASDFLVHLSFSPFRSLCFSFFLLWHVMASLFHNSAHWTKSLKSRKGTQIILSL